jgi:hypothetical protein
MIEILYAFIVSFGSTPSQILYAIFAGYVAMKAEMTVIKRKMLFGRGFL